MEPTSDRVIVALQIDPNYDLPGMDELMNFAGSLQGAALIACVIGLVVAAITWAIGSQGSNPHVAGRGKSGALWAVAAGVVVIAAPALITWAQSVGQGI